MFSLVKTLFGTYIPIPAILLVRIKQIFWLCGQFTICIRNATILTINYSNKHLKSSQNALLKTSNTLNKPACKIFWRRKTTEFGEENTIANSHNWQTFALNIL